MFMKIKFPWTNFTTKNQYITIFNVNVLTLIHGCAIGWTSPTILNLRSNDTHLETGVVSTSEASWIGSLMFLGSLIGVFTVGIVADTIGKKKCLAVMTFPTLIFWIRTVVSTDVYDFYIARTVAGLTGGALLRIVPLFIEEIADNKIHAELGAYSMLSMSIGILLIFVLETYVNYFIIPFIIVPILILYFTFMMILPETPQFFLRKLKDEEALQSLKFYRNYNEKNFQNVEVVKHELEAMRKCVFNDQKDEPQIKDYFEKSSLYGLKISFILGIIASCSGYMTILTYTADIFNSSGSSLSANESSIVVAFSNFIGIYFVTIFADKFRRKILMTISCAGSGLSLLILASYSYIVSVNELTEHYKWIPIVTLSFTMFLSAIGISSLPCMIVTELVSQKIRDTTVLMFMGLVTVLTFANLKVFPILVEYINLSNCMFIYAGVCLLGALFSILILPETKNKT